MYPFTNTVITDTALSHCRTCGFFITLLDVNGNDPNPKRHAAIRSFLAAVGRRTAEVVS